jgi:sugar diacid utilization regulator
MRVLAVAGEAPDPFGEAIRADSLASLLGEREIARVIGEMREGRSAVLGTRDALRTSARVVAPIIAGTEILGSLWVTCARRALEATQPLIDQASRVVALELMNERALVEVGRRLGRELLDELFLGRPTSALRRRAQEMSVDLERPYRLAVLAANDPREDGATTGVAVEATLSHVRKEPWCVFAAEHGENGVALLDPAFPDAAACLDRLLAGLMPRLRARAVVSPPCTTPEHYRARFDACSRALELFGDRFASPVMDLAGARLLTLLLSKGRQHDVEQFVEESLGSVLVYDAAHRAALAPTLEAYFDVNASPTRAAVLLHVHVNTVYYRLERIRELLGEDFDTPQRALDIRVALAARHLLDLEESPNAP